MAPVRDFSFRISHFSSRSIIHSFIRDQIVVMEKIQFDLSNNAPELF
ncbi:hypothetical protein VCRA2113O324_420008 [Vibrio crassostreae]|nr:hypothetical protein VCRA2113O324_420008 [Vibrio crassostreae]CAK2124800.1 hypothetical protein VCRA2111O320_410009 [Vibrio crassostreae]CAK2984879.1 hypothetical protein VCRA2121O336_430009 [Vibrio crassostreae]CAK3968886.1 hypothetical protein VCRA2128O347_460009 [Vibrio crassostreae]